MMRRIGLLLLVILVGSCVAQTAQERCLSRSPPGIWIVAGTKIVTYLGSLTVGCSICGSNPTNISDTGGVCCQPSITDICSASSHPGFSVIAGALYSPTCSQCGGIPAYVSGPCCGRRCCQTRCGPRNCVYEASPFNQTGYCSNVPKPGYTGQTAQCENGCKCYPTVCSPSKTAPLKSLNALTCECAQQIQSDVLPGVFSATKDLSNVVDELFTVANRAEINPVTDRTFCFFCGRIRRTYSHVHGGWHRRWRPTYHHYGHHHGHHHWRRQVPQEALLTLPVCPIEDVRTTETNAKDGAQVVREVLAGVKADPKEISQDLLDDVTQLYNEVKESEKSLKSVTSSINTECSSNQSGSAVVFPDKR